MEGRAFDSLERPGQPSRFTCPDCDGNLVLIDDKRVLRFRCRVGHAWSSASLLTQQASAVETALWMAMRSMEERAVLTNDMSQRAAERGHRRTAEMFDAQSSESHRAARLVRGLLTTTTGQLISHGEPTNAEQA